MLKKILIIISILAVTVILIVHVCTRYDAKIVKETSEEYKRLYDITSVDFYKKNHLLVDEIDTDGNAIINDDALYIPDLKKYENYKPEYVDKYQNIDSNNDNKYIEVYRLYLVDDDFYRENLNEYFGKSDIVYMKIGINNMNLITFVSLTKTIDGKDIYGPMIYEYYHDKG